MVMQLLRKPSTLFSIATFILATSIGGGMEMLGWGEQWRTPGILVIVIGCIISLFFFWVGIVQLRRDKKRKRADRMILDAKAKDLLALPDALRALSDLDIELADKLSTTTIPTDELKSIQERLRGDWRIRPSETYDNLSEGVIKDTINQTVKSMNLAYTSVNEETMMFFMHIVGVLDEHKAGFSELREKDARYSSVHTLKAKVATQGLRGAIRVYDWYSLGMSSLLLLLSYFPANSVGAMMRMLGKTHTELRAAREQTLSYLLTTVSAMVEKELHVK